MIEDTPTTRAHLATSLHVHRWVEEVAAGAPFRDVDALVRAADLAATDLTPAEVSEALAQHPRIGERPAGAGVGAALSRREQSAARTDDPALVAAMARGNQAYEDRFGRVFLIRAAGRSRPEILAELDRRLTLDDDTEVAEVADQLREIALLRLRTLFTEETA